MFKPCLPTCIVPWLAAAALHETPVLLGTSMSCKSAAAGGETHDQALCAGMAVPCVVINACWLPFQRVGYFLVDSRG